MKKSWLVWPIAFSAFVATWGGWVVLGTMTGYGKVNMLPGLVKDGEWSTINLVISLPAGVEAYGALALSVAFDQRATRAARWFSAVSSLVSLVLGCFAQAVAHNLSSKHVTTAPDAVTSFVAVLPVLVLGMASALAVLSQKRISETSQAASQKVSQWSGMLGRLAEAATDRAVSRLSHPGETSHPGRLDVSPLPVPMSPAPAGMDVSAGHNVVARPSPAPSETRRPVKVALEKDPETVDRVSRWMGETDPPTVTQVAERLGTSRATAGRVVKKARELVPVGAEVTTDVE